MENMAEGSDKDFFTYVWRIENFSMCPQQKGECIISPNFVVDVLDKTTWYLELFPKGNFHTKADCLSCYLHRALEEEEPEEIKISYDIQLVSQDVESYALCRDNRTFDFFTGYGYSILADLSELLKNRETHFPNDTLTILCAMQRAESSDMETEINISVPRVNYTCLMDKSFTVISDVDASSEHRLDTRIDNSHIPVERSQLKWIIKHFKEQMETVRNISATVVSSLRGKSEIILHCYIKGDRDTDGSVMIDIQRKDIDLQQMLLKCEVSVLDKNGDVQESLEDQHLFGKGYEVWTLKPIVKLSTIENRQTELLPEGSLTLSCEFRMSFKEEVTVEGQTKHESFSDMLYEGVINMLHNEELWDVSLVCEGYEFPVHKTVICAWSPVFRAMFDNDTEEKRTGVVYINDMEMKLVMIMTEFMYGIQLPDLLPEDALKLYLAADKYEILDLKKLCAASLKYNLSVSNVCEVLLLADLHQDEDLLKCVNVFLRVHSDEVFQSTEWMNILETKPKFASETMRKLLLKE